jgi:hypothetical protein
MPKFHLLRFRRAEDGHNRLRTSSAILAGNLRARESGPRGELTERRLLAPAAIDQVAADAGDVPGRARSPPALNGLQIGGGANDLRPVI